MANPDGAQSARRRPLVRRLMLKDFRSYATLDLTIEAVSSSYAARTAPARPISSRRSRCSRRDGACAGRSSRGMRPPGRRGGFALSVEVDDDGGGFSLGRAGRRGTERRGPSG